MHPTIRFALVVALTALLCLSGCSVSQAIREEALEIERQRLTGYSKQIAATAVELSRASPCCDDLSLVSPHGRADGEQPFRASLGTWPSKKVAEIDGFRSYYSLVAFDTAKDDRSNLVFRLSPGTYRIVADSTASPAHEIFVPTVTFLDQHRNRLTTVVGHPASNFQSPVPTARVAVPQGASFAVIYTSSNALQMSGLTAYIPPKTSGGPIGGVTLLLHTQGYTARLLPQYTGDFSVTLN